MVAKIDRIGEKGINNFGSEMIIVEYRNRIDIDVYFPEYDYTAKGIQYSNFKRGTILCPYERRTYGVGYLGEGKYKIHDKNGKITKCYNTWHDMLKRCYDTKYKEKHLTYSDCEVYNESLCYQNFGDWFIDNYYEIEGQKMHLDKDILYKGNKIYSPENCIFVPHNINVLFTKRDKMRGEYPIGVNYHKASKKFQAYCIYKGKRKVLGYYDNIKDAFNSYKQFKEQYIKEVADEYKGEIPQRLYNAMYRYEVEITD